MSLPVIHVTALCFLLWNWASRDSKPESSQHWSPSESERTVRKRRQWALWCQSDLWCHNLSVDALTCANYKKRTTQISVIWCQSVVYTRCNLQVIRTGPNQKLDLTFRIIFPWFLDLSVEILSVHLPVLFFNHVFFPSILPHRIRTKIYSSKPSRWQITSKRRTPYM